MGVRDAKFAAVWEVAVLDYSVKNCPTPNATSSPMTDTDGGTEGKEEKGEGTSCQIWDFRDGFSQEVAFMLSLQGRWCGLWIKVGKAFWAEEYTHEAISGDLCHFSSCLPHLASTVEWVRTHAFSTGDSISVCRNSSGSFNKWLISYFLCRVLLSTQLRVTSFQAFGPQNCSIPLPLSSLPYLVKGRIVLCSFFCTWQETTDN